MDSEQLTTADDGVANNTRWRACVTATFAAVQGDHALLELIGAQVEVEAGHCAAAVTAVEAILGGDAGMAYTDLTAFADDAEVRWEFSDCGGVLASSRGFAHGTGIHDMRIDIMINEDSGEEWHLDEWSSELKPA